MCRGLREERGEGGREEAYILFRLGRLGRLGARNMRCVGGRWSLVRGKLPVEWPI